jgi:hypothetical protein
MSAALKTSGGWTRAGIASDGPSANDTSLGEDVVKKKEEKGTIAQYLDKQLEHEFKNEELASLNKQDLNETLSREKVSSPQRELVAARALHPCSMLLLAARLVYDGWRALWAPTPAKWLHRKSLGASQSRAFAGISPGAGGQGDHEKDQVQRHRRGGHE